MARRKLRRYKFSGLPKLTREQVRVLNAMMGYLPSSPFEADFKDKLREVLEPLVHADIDLWLDTVSVVPPGGLEGHLCSPTCVAAVGLLPTAHTMLVEIDLTVAQQAVDKMLGGDAEDVDGQRPLSEIEEGVFSFILLRALELAQQGFGTEHQLALKLNGVYGRYDALAARISEQTAWTCVSYKLFFDIAVGFVRLYVPNEIVSETLARPQHLEGPAQSRALRRLGETAPRIGALKVALQIEVGRIPFAYQDLAGLDAGDIILIEDPTVRLVGEALDGQVRAHVGLGNYGTVQGTLMVGETGTYEVAIDQILAVAPPPTQGAVVDGAGEGEESMDERSIDEQHARAHARPWSAGEQTAAEVRARLSAHAGRVAGRPLRTGVEQPLAEEHSEGESEEEGYEDEEPLPEAAGMLSDVAVAVVVELGRVSVSAADVMALRPGQVIEHSRSPGDPVDLVVDGKRLGKGELVEIEGELGVRILELVG